MSGHVEYKEQVRALMAISLSHNIMARQTSEYSALLRQDRDYFLLLRLGTQDYFTRVTNENSH